MGDFIYVVNLEDKAEGSSIIDIAMREFKECVDKIEVSDKVKEVVAHSWNMEFDGYSMFCLVKKLKALKKPLRNLLYEHGNLHDKVKRLRFKLDEVQKALDKDPSNSILREEEALYLHSRVTRIRIDMVADSNDVMMDRNAVPNTFISHDVNFLGQAGVSAWDIVGCDVINAVREFFASKKLLKKVNHMAIALILKVTSPARINDYRPISLCNVVLNALLMHNYHLDRGPLRFAFSGTLHGHIKGKRGLRKGDPLSPYIFTLVMEILTLVLKCKVCNFGDFVFHHHCEELDIINLCFTDDLFLFAHGDVNSVRVSMKALEEFKNVLDLVPSLLKSTTYFCNVLNHVKLAILNVLPFEEGNLLVKYLVVSLDSQRLVYKDRKELVKKVQKRVTA
ncbi:hypothetical protein Tco_1120896 [Tanacetum coccineum]|uniref:Reverse transcriptase domain-containing protein n=1 Tax=Tanacetum coccineum TaxID=301880 RepID=A0ABQ5IW62_9ASTR